MKLPFAGGIGSRTGVWMAAGAVACLVWAAGAARAEDADALSKTIDTTLRSAERSMFSGKTEDALEAVTKAGALLDELKAADPGHKSLSILQGKHERLKKDIERRAGKTVGAPPPAAPSPAPPAAPSAGPRPAAPAAAPAAEAAAGEALPGGVQRRVKMIRRALEGDRTIREDPEDLLAEIEKQYAGQYPPDHPDIVDVKRRLAERRAAQEAEAKAEAAAAEQATKDQAEQEATSKPWIEKLTPYVTAYDTANERPNPKCLVATTTQDVEELKRLKAVYDEAKAAFDAYQKAALPKGKSRELRVLEEDLAERLREFVKAYETNVGRVLQNPAQPLDEALARLEKDTAWRDDPRAMPLVLSARDLDALREGIDRAAKLDPASPAIGELRRKLDALVRLNDERRNTRTGRTLMIADRFSGGDLKELKPKADSVVQEKFGGATILRTTVISRDWKEEDVVEWTDTTQSAARRRVTRSVSAQVAARQADGVFLYTVHLAQDRRSDGSWSPLYGHIMFTDAMLEENIRKNAP